MEAYGCTAPPPIQVALFYKYVPVTDPDATVVAQKTLCERLGLAGRLRVALVRILRI